MSQTVIHAAMNEDLKRRFDEICTESGLNAEAVFNEFARTVVREKKDWQNNKTFQ